MSRDPIQQYTSKLKKHLVLPRKHGQNFLEGLSQELREYAQEQASCTYEQLEETFGKPEYVAHQFIEQSDSADLVRRMKRRRVIFRAFMAVLIFVAIVLSILVYIMASHTEVRVTERIIESHRQYENQI